MAVAKQAKSRYEIDACTLRFAIQMEICWSCTRSLPRASLRNEGSSKGDILRPEERSRILRQQADEILLLIGLGKLVAPIGPLMPTGSYFMDLMMYPDIDVNLPLTSPDRLMGVGAELSKLDCVQKIRFLRGKDGPTKDGFYLKPEIEYGDWGRLWKIDIWSLPALALNNAQTEMVDLKNRMTPAHRAIILNTKYRLLNDEGRTPMYSGIFIYRAVINLGMTEQAAIEQYLVDNGIIL